MNIYDYFLILFIMILINIILSKLIDKNVEGFDNNNINKIFELLPKNIDQKTWAMLNNLPLLQYFERGQSQDRDRDRRVVYDPLTAPERRYNNRYNGGYNYYNPYINYPTRGLPEPYQMIGYLSRSNDEKFLQLYGRTTYPGSNLWEYYVGIEQNGYLQKIPLQNNKEFFDGDTISIPGMNGNFIIKLYNYNTPRYNPYDY